MPDHLRAQRVAFPLATVGLRRAAQAEAAAGRHRHGGGHRVLGMNRWRRDVEGSAPSFIVQPGAVPPATVGISETSATPGPIQLTIHGDAPAQKDELGRGSYVQALANVITHADTPLVIAIYGAWGAGKTSLMIQLRDSLKLSRESGRVPRTVWFNPWMHQSDETPVLGLLHETAEQLGQLGKQRVKEALVNIGRAMAAEVQVPVIGFRVGRVLDEVAEGLYERRTQQAQIRKHFESVLDAAGRKDGRPRFSHRRSRSLPPANCTAPA